MRPRPAVGTARSLFLASATFGLKGGWSSTREAGSRRRCDRNATIDHMAIKKMEHVGIVVDDLTTAIEFFVQLGLEPGGTARSRARW